MIVYIVIYDKGWNIDKVDSNLLKDWSTNKVCRYRDKVGFYGNIYNKEVVFKSEEAALAWIIKDYGVSNKNKYYN